MHNLKSFPLPGAPVACKAIVRLHLDSSDWRVNGNPIDDDRYQRVHRLEKTGNRILFPSDQGPRAQTLALYIHDSEDEESQSTLVVPDISSVNLEEDHAWTTAGPDHLMNSPGLLVQALAGIDGLGDPFTVSGFFARPMFHLEAIYASTLRNLNLERLQVEEGALPLPQKLLDAQRDQLKRWLHGIYLPAVDRSVTRRPIVERTFVQIHKAPISTTAQRALALGIFGEDLFVALHAKREAIFAAMGNKAKPKAPQRA